MIRTALIDLFAFPIFGLIVGDLAYMRGYRNAMAYCTNKLRQANNERKS